jgi:hypothetical protein
MMILNIDKMILIIDLRICIINNKVMHILLMRFMNVINQGLQMTNIYISAYKLIYKMKCGYSLLNCL